jgi:hypothetical protein
MTKSLKKLGIAGMYTKAMHDQLTANIILNAEKLQQFHLKSGTGQK